MGPQPTRFRRLRGLVSQVLQLPSQSVYSKALTLFVAFSLLLGSAVFLLTSEILLREFRETERQEMIATLQRFTLMLARETRPMEISLANWLRTAHEDPVHALPDPGTLGAMQLDFISIGDGEGAISSTVFRDSQARMIFLSGSPWTHWLKGARETALQRSGFILLGDSLTALVWIEDADGRRIAGGRIFDDEAFSFLEGMFGARVSFTPLRSLDVARPGDEPLLALLSRNEFVVRADAQNEIVGHILIRGINGTPIGQVKLTQGRPLYAEGLQAVQIFLTAITLAGGTLFVIMWVLLDRTILARIRDLTRRVVTNLDKLPLRLDFAGNDELVTLARTIESLAQQLDRARLNYRAVVEDQNEIICRFTPAFSVTFSNTVFQRLFPCDAAGTTFLRTALPTATFELIASKFSALTPAQPLDTFLHQLPSAERSTLWLRSTLRGNFRPDGECEGGQWMAADSTAQVQAQQKLEDSERQLRSLTSRLLRLQDDERRKIARELHDSTAQSLSALEMNMSLLEPAAGSEFMQRIVAETRQIARDCCMELRTISYLLHPPLLDEVGLGFAIQWFVEGFSKRTSIDAQVRMQPDFPRLAEEVETTLFRVLQEAMSNIYRHSGATKAWVTINIVDGLAILEVRDNGTGFAEGAKAPTNLEGVGLAGMRERLSQLGGVLEVRSSPYGVSILAKLSTLADAKETDPDR